MKAGFYLITGTSRGIGEALALKLLEDGHTVLGVSRKRSGRLSSARYHHLSFDMTDTDQIGKIMEKAAEIVDQQSFDLVCLVNNASAVEPIQSIENCPPAEIEAHIQIGLLAPMILTSLFIRRFSRDNARKKVAFISSGAAFRPLPGESIYCGSKAGLHMFARCVGEEQKNLDDGFEVISVGPGMVNTSMQQAARSKSSEEFAMADFFKQAYQDGRLEDPLQVAKKIVTILENRYEQGEFVSVADV